MTTARAGTAVPREQRRLEASRQRTAHSDILFGQSRGAFTGADQAWDGVIASAVEGTLFLDEIGDLSVASQVKLLRLLQEGTFYPLGADRPR